MGATFLGNVTVECSLLAAPLPWHAPQSPQHPQRPQRPQGQQGAPDLAGDPRQGAAPLWLGALALQILRGILVKVPPPPCGCGALALQVLMVILVMVVPPPCGYGALALEILRGILVNVPPPPVVVERWRSRS